MNNAEIITYAAALKLLKTGASIEAGTLVTMPQNVSGSELRAGLGAYGVNVEQGDVLRDLPPRKSRPFAVYCVV